MRSGDLCDRAIDKFAVGKRHSAVSRIPSPHKIYLAGRICSETTRRRVLKALSLPACDILLHRIKDYGVGFQTSQFGIPSFSLTRFRL